MKEQDTKFTEKTFAVSTMAQSKSIKSSKEESEKSKLTKFVGTSDAIIDIHELRKRIEPIIRNPHSLLHFPSYHDYTRDLIYNIASVGHWLLSVPTPTRVYTQNDRSFIFCKHTTFDNVRDIHPLAQQKRIASSYALARISRRFPPFYSLAYHTEYGKSSFWASSHLTDIRTNKVFAHSISMSVMIDGRTRRPQSVIPAIKALCDNNWINEYPKQFKHGIYPKLKKNCSNHISVLNAVRNDENKKLIFSYCIQMRYGDEDMNKHLNTHTYSRYANECLLNYDEELRNNEAALFWMTNVYWKETRMQSFRRCFVNIWKVEIGDGDKVYVGTVDVDDVICRRDNDKTGDEVNLENLKWKHHNGFMAKVVSVSKVTQPSKL